MTDYRQLMRLVLDKVPYREIAARQGCSQRTIAKVRRVLDEHQLAAVSQIDALMPARCARLVSRPAGGRGEGDGSVLTQASGSALGLASCSARITAMACFTAV